MKFIWEKYSFKDHKDIDCWNELNAMIDKYAMFGEVLSDQDKEMFNLIKDKVIDI